MAAITFSPFPQLRTQRTVLRQLIQDDDHPIFQLRSNQAVNQYIARNPYKSVEDAQLFIAKMNAGIAKGEWIYWAIALKETDELIGTACIWNISEQNKRAEIGYELAPEWQGRGLMQEVLEAVLKYGFEQMQLHSIEAVVHPGNSASIKLLERNGFVKEAHFKENVLFNGEYRDTAIYSLLNKGG